MNCCSRIRNRLEFVCRQARISLHNVVLAETSGWYFILSQKGFLMLSQKQLFWREFWLLFGVAMVISLITWWLMHFPLEALTDLFPIQARPKSIWLTVLMYCGLQTIELAVFVSVGLWAAHRVGMGAPILESWLRNEHVDFRIRRYLTPVAVTAAVVAIGLDLLALPIFHPNRKQITAAVNELMNNAGNGKLPNLASMQNATRLTPISLTASWIARAVVGELHERLFMVSVFVVLGVLIFRQLTSPANKWFVWAGIFAVILLHLIESIYRDAIGTQTTQIFYSQFHLPRDPFWLVAIRSSLGTTLRDLGLGWVYVSFGIESAIVASFLAAVIANFLFRHVFIYLM